MLDRLAGKLGRESGLPRVRAVRRCDREQVAHRIADNLDVGIGQGRGRVYTSSFVFDRRVPHGKGSVDRVADQHAKTDQLRAVLGSDRPPDPAQA